MKLTPENLFKALADPTRLRCLMLLHREGELCVCEMTHALGLAQPKVSRHLALMREVGLVNDRREGVWIHYSLSPDLPAWAGQILQATRSGLDGDGALTGDLGRLSTMPNRPARVHCA